MTSSAPERLLYLSPSPLSSFAQRPHHFVHWFHNRYNAPVFWIDPGPSRLPRTSDWPRLVKQLRRGAAGLTGGMLAPALGPVWRNEAWLQHAAAHVLPFEPYAFGRRVNQILWHNLLQRTDRFVNGHTVLVMGKPCALSLALAKRYSQNHCIFDAMDHMPGFCTGVSRQWMLQAEAKLAQKAHAIWASSHALAESHAAHADKVSLVLNALTEPSKQTYANGIEVKHTLVLGYLGVIDRWFDWKRVIDLAISHSHAQVRLIGPMHCAPPGPLPSNVQCLAPVSQHDVYQAMAQFDVGLIPFELNDVTRYVDPVKYYEYRALGLPVLSTQFGEMAHRSAVDGVHFWEHLESGELKLDDLIGSRSLQAHTQQFCDENNWKQRFDAIAHTLDNRA